MTFKPSVEVALRAGALLGEGPVWDETCERLLWVDIQRRELHRFDPSTCIDEVDYMSSQVSAVAPRINGGLVMAMEDNIAVKDTWMGELEVIARPSAMPKGGRFNDGACDPLGRFWVGTLTKGRSKGASSLYRLEPSGQLTEMLSGVTVSNGLGWSPDGRTLYYVDTPTLGVDAFDFQPDSGELSNRRRIVTIEAESGRPDGLCVDIDGGIWVCLIFGGAIHRYRPDGCLDRRIELPVTRVTSCAFGGPKLDILFLTSAAAGLSPEELSDQPHAGDILCFAPGVGGLPSTPFYG